jgi:type 1 glutamine amidotransferase
MRSIAAVLLLSLSGHCLAQDAVLVFSRTLGFRHGSIANGVAMIQQLGAQNGFSVEATEDPTRFTAAGLAPFDAVVFLSTTGNVLDDAQQAAFQAWLEGGRGWVGIHAAADCEYAWPWYGAQILGNGAWFLSHPAIQQATLLREVADDPSTAHLPASFDFTDEWYNFRANPRPGATVLLRLDEASYSPGSGAMGADHPISWKRTVGAGRAWYTGLGHRNETFADARFRQHVLGGLQWAIGTESLVFGSGFEPTTVIAARRAASRSSTGCMRRPRSSTTSCAATCTPRSASSASIRAGAPTRRRRWRAGGKRSSAWRWRKWGICAWSAT